MWVGIILIGSVWLNAAHITRSPETFGSQEACQVWVDDAISTLKAMNSFQPDGEQLMAMGECTISQERDL